MCHGLLLTWQESHVFALDPAIEAAHEFKCAEVYVAPELKPEFEVQGYPLCLMFFCSFYWGRMLERLEGSFGVLSH